MTVKEYQTDPIKKYARKVATVESGNNPNAKNPYSSAGGLHQFLESSFTGISDKYNLGYSAEDRFDPKKSERAFELFTKDNEKVLRKTLGDNITDGDRYLAHFLGAGGANKFFQAYKQNPNADASTVFSPQVIAANKSVLSGKKLQDVYQWANAKMDIDVDNVTQNFINYETPQNSINFTESPVDLKELPEQPKEVTEAKESLKQQTNEFNFLKDLQTFQSKQPQQIAQETQQQQLKAPNILGIYEQVSQFVENPLMQEGGIIEDNLGYLNPQNIGKVVRINSPNITMKGVNIPLLGIDNLGNKQIMLPNQDYKFQGTSVTEYPLQKYFSK